MNTRFGRLVGDVRGVLADRRVKRIFRSLTLVLFACYVGSEIFVSRDFIGLFSSGKLATFLSLFPWFIGVIIGLHLGWIVFVLRMRGKENDLALL